MNLPMRRSIDPLVVETSRCVRSVPDLKSLDVSDWTLVSLQHFLAIDERLLKIQANLKFFHECYAMQW